MPMNLQQILLRQRVHQPFDGGTRQLTALRDLPQTHAPLIAFQALENRRDPGHDLYATAFTCGQDTSP